MLQTRSLIAALLGATLAFAAPTKATDLRSGSSGRVTLRSGPIAATVTAARPGSPLPAWAEGASSVEFHLWAQSSLGPLNLIVFSHSAEPR